MRRGGGAARERLSGDREFEDADGSPSPPRTPPDALLHAMSDRREQLEEWKRQKAARASLGGVAAVNRGDEQRKLSFSSQGRLSGGRPLGLDAVPAAPAAEAAKPSLPSKSPKTLRRASVAPSGAAPRVSTLSSIGASSQAAARPAMKAKQSVEVLQAGLSSLETELERTQKEREQLQLEIESLNRSVAAGKKREAELQDSIQTLSEEKRLLEVRPSSVIKE